MKAYIVNEKGKDYRTVVFAESRGKARATAMLTECCEDAAFINIEARRLPKADSQYRCQREMDWNHDIDRLFLVKEAGFHCEYAEPDECALCLAKEYCDEYQAALEEYEAEGEV